MYRRGCGAHLRACWPRPVISWFILATVAVAVKSAHQCLQSQTMWQDILRLHLPFNLPIIGDELVIHSFGLMLVIGFLSAMYLAKFLARKSKLDPEVFANACLIALFAGVIGARLSHVLENLSD